MEFNDQGIHSATNSVEQTQNLTGNSPLSVQTVGEQLIVPVVLSGGGGSRLWPFSTKETPKQFLPLLDHKTLFEEALDRVSDRLRFAAPVVVGSVQHAELCERLLEPEGDQALLLLEPCARNTAPAIIMAATVIQEFHGSDALMLVMPSDHLIEDIALFHQAIAAGERAARAGWLVTFGVRPTGPDTGYGYLQMGDDIAGSPGVKSVRCFVEKPQHAVAKSMVAAGDHLWNAGIFLFRAASMLEEAERTCPEIADAAREAVALGQRDGIRIAADPTVFANCPSDSIDYAVMERSGRVAVVPMSPGWSDLGSWDALASLLGSGAVGPVAALECKDCFIRSDGVQVAALGLNDLIIVASGERLLILPKGRSQEVKKLLAIMDSKAA